MIYLIACGITPEDQIEEVLEGPEGLETDVLWEQFELAHNNRVGPFPKSTLYETKPSQERLDWEAKHELTIQQLMARWNVTDRIYAVTNCFVEMLIQVHKCKRLTHKTIHTEK